MSDTYTVSLKKFEGPLEALYTLIEKRKLHINTVSLATITDGYLEYLRENQHIAPEKIAQFILIAATLVLIKSKSLLPILEYTEEEKTDIESLTSRLKLYKYIQNSAMPALDSWRIVSLHNTPSKQKKEPIFSPDASCTITSMHTIATTVVQNLATFQGPPQKIVKKLITLEDAIKKTLETIRSRITVSFKEITEKKGRYETIISFLAILELIRKNILAVAQKAHFTDITITHLQDTNKEAHSKDISPTSI